MSVLPLKIYIDTVKRNNETIPPEILSTKTAISPMHVPIPTFIQDLTSAEIEKLIKLSNEGSVNAHWILHNYYWRRKDMQYSGMYLSRLYKKNNLIRYDPFVCVRLGICHYEHKRQHHRIVTTDKKEKMIIKNDFYIRRAMKFDPFSTNEQLAYHMQNMSRYSLALYFSNKCAKYATDDTDIHSATLVKHIVTKNLMDRIHKIVAKVKNNKVEKGI
jgi:hypothetical protein